MFEGRAPRLWLRLEQHADKPYFARIPNSLADGFIINANLIESAPDACASFLDQTGKPFLIDPITYRFERVAWYTRPDGDGEPIGKRNYSRLWARYSDRVPGLTGDALRDRGVRGIESDEAVIRFCHNVISFQEERLRSAWAESGALFVMDRLPFVGQLAPSAYVAPYLVIGASDIGVEIERASSFVRATTALARPRPVVAVLPIMPSLLCDLAHVRSLASSIADSGARTVLVWPVGTSATDLADHPELFTGLAVLLRDLRDAGSEEGLLYGGILTSLLRGFGASGFSHGLSYGEVRGLDPSGGRPPLRFYFPPLRQTLSYDAAERIVLGMSRDEYLETVCLCVLCREIAAGGVRELRAYFQRARPEGSSRALPTLEALDLNRFHYLLARDDELSFARARNEGRLIADILATADRFPERASASLRRWADLLKAA